MNGRIATTSATELRNFPCPSCSLKCADFSSFRLHHQTQDCKKRQRYKKGSKKPAWISNIREESERLVESFLEEFPAEQECQTEDTTTTMNNLHGEDMNNYSMKEETKEEQLMRVFPEEYPAEQLNQSEAATSRGSKSHDEDMANFSITEEIFEERLRRAFISEFPDEQLNQPEDPGNILHDEDVIYYPKTEEIQEVQPLDDFLIADYFDVPIDEQEQENPVGEDDVHEVEDTVDTLDQAQEDTYDLAGVEERQCPDCLMIVPGLDMNEHRQNIHGVSPHADSHMDQVINDVINPPQRPDSNVRYWTPYPVLVNLELRNALFRCADCQQVCNGYESLTKHNWRHRQRSRDLNLLNPLTLLANEEDKRRITKMLEGYTHVNGIYHKKRSSRIESNQEYDSRDSAPLHCPFCHQLCTDLNRHVEQFHSIFSGVVVGESTEEQGEDEDTEGRIDKSSSEQIEQAFESAHSFLFNAPARGLPQGEMAYFFHMTAEGHCFLLVFPPMEIIDSRFFSVKNPCDVCGEGSYVHGTRQWYTHVTENHSDVHILTLLTGKQINAIQKQFEEQFGIYTRIMTVLHPISRVFQSYKVTCYTLRTEARQVSDLQ